MPFIIYNTFKKIGVTRFVNQYRSIMRSIVLCFIAFISCQYVIGQEITLTTVDSLYKEDQFYIGITYNVLGNMPQGMSQNGFSSGFHLGYIKDIPINKNRNIALGLGLGYSANSFNQDLLITKKSQGSHTYVLLSRSEFTKNKFSRHLIEIPFEFRWRTSTPETYKFWRVYTGFKLGYLFASTTKFASTSQNIKQKDITDFETIQYGLTLSVGYNTWNAYLYYGLNPLFKKEAVLDGESIDLKAIKVGIMFYLL